MSILSKVRTLVAFSCSVEVEFTHTLHKQELYEELWKARLFALCPNYQTKPHLDFNNFSCYSW